MDCAATLGAIEQQIQFVTHYSVYASTIRRRLQHSAMSPRHLLIRLPLTRNRRCLSRQWGDERRTSITEWKDIVFTDESCFCLQHHDGRIRVYRLRGERLLNCYVRHRPTDLASSILV
ncbi:transposable element Tcb1 transposase [Trichonephila clavipes]|nr:transposable element Tcb1 transposase [Trichonephila clavipes]